MEPATWGFIGTMVGALASIATTLLSSRQAARLQEGADSRDRRERSRAFQRDTLLSIQDVVLECMRFMARADREDFLAFKESGTWRGSSLSETVNEGSRLSNARLAVLIERVADDSLRSSLRDVQAKINARAFSRTPEEAVVAMQDAAQEHIAVMEELGKVLRNQY